MGNFNLEQHQLTVARSTSQSPAQLAVRARHSLREGRQHRGEWSTGRLFRREDRPIAQGQAGGQTPGFGRETSGGGRSTSRATRRRSRSIASARSITSTRASASTASTASPAGTRTYRIKVRVICSRPYHALFMHTMLIRPTPEELASFGTPDFTIYNAGAFPANRLTAGMGSTTSVALSLEDRELVILGHRVRRRDEERRLHGRELFRAEARNSLDALLGHGGQADRAVVAALRPQRHRQDDALRRSEAAPHRRRRALLERRRHLQHRRRLLREGDQPHARERAGHLPGAALRRRARERRARRGSRRGLHRHEHHGEHARRVSDRIHPQREDPVHRRPSDATSSS